MAQLERQREERAGKRADKRAKSADSPKNHLLTFNPTPAQRLAVTAFSQDGDRVADSLASLLARGVKVTVGFARNQSCYYVIAREDITDWQEARAISMMHRELSTALAGVVYACTDVYEGFPDCALPNTSMDVDW